jgi:phenylalanyl-tRNA synthetase beta chain
MKVTYSWLKDFVDIKIPAQELADKLTMAGLEVVSLEARSGDFILEIEITSNRPDWLSVRGIAREVSAITGSKLKELKIGKEPKAIIKLGPKIDIEDRKDTPLYSARIIKGVSVKESPAWLKNRLELIGCRSVNNIVDITNYCLFELGEPLHAFDLDKINSSRIYIRRARAGEKILTIDSVQRSLDPNILVIADKDNCLAIAGVMGGKDTEVSYATKNILLEAAVFNPVVVRRGRQRLGIQSESSYRFERGVDPESVNQASLRAAELIKEIAAGENFALSREPARVKSRARVVKLDMQDAHAILGINMPDAKVKSILKNLGFKVKPQVNRGLGVSVPTFRQDVTLQEDLIEEVSRIFGYNRIPLTLPSVKPNVTIRERRDLISGIKNVLVGLGLSEVITYSLTDSDSLNCFGGNSQAETLGVLNPLSREQEVLRTSLLPGLSRVIAFNLNQKSEFVSVFEVANIFNKDKDLPKEELVLGLGLSGKQRIFLKSGAFNDEVGLLNLKGILEAVFNLLGIKEYDFSWSSERVDVYAQKIKVGFLMQLNSAARERFNIKNKEAFLAQVSLDKVLPLIPLEKKIVPLPRYPGITRDISFILKEDICVKNLLRSLEEKPLPLLQSVKITDYYKGKQIPAGYRGLTISCFYCSSERTLTEEEIQPLHNQICEILNRDFGVKMR